MKTGITNISGFLFPGGTAANLSAIHAREIEAYLENLTPSECGTVKSEEDKEAILKWCKEYICVHKSGTVAEVKFHEEHLECKLRMLRHIFGSCRVYLASDEDDSWERIHVDFPQKNDPKMKNLAEDIQEIFKKIFEEKENRMRYMGSEVLDENGDLIFFDSQNGFARINQGHEAWPEAKAVYERAKGNKRCKFDSSEGASISHALLPIAIGTTKSTQQRERGALDEFLKEHQIPDFREFEPNGPAWGFKRLYCLSGLGGGSHGVPILILM